MAKTILLPADTVQGYAWIQFAFSNPQTIKAVTIVSDRKRSIFGIVDPSEDRSLEVSDDGVNFSHITFIPLGRFAPQTVTIPVTTAKYFRIKFKNPPAPTGFAAIMSGATKPPAGTHIAEIMLHTATRIDHFEEKAGFAAAYDLLENPTPATTRYNCRNRCDRFNRQDECRWYPELDSSGYRRQLENYSLWLFAHR